MTDPAAKTDKPGYKATLNLPKTAFAMKANLVQREPAFQKRWAQTKLYDRLRKNSAGRNKFCLHDGPPYANGAIHLGHLLNKVLKDMVVRSRTMLGFDVPFVPGWDCHGLPIEHKVLKDLGEKAAGMVPMQIRARCKTDAEKFIKLQAAQMQRLGTLGDYENPYLTMAPAYEGATLEVFADLVERGLVVRALKPVHWSIANRTALAEAELEYIDREDQSVFVLFEVEHPENLPSSLMVRAGEPVSLMIWTTTPWTLPANLAVAVAAEADYTLYQWELDGRLGLSVVASALGPKLFDRMGAAYTPLGSCVGRDLEQAGMRYWHPFIERSSPVVTADYVTLEDGTGLVHTAPGHGVEDYQTGLRCGLDIYCPVQPDGTFDDTAPAWLRGKDVWAANGLVIDHLKEIGHLFLAEAFTHSYPHDWRSKTPVIFRATEQWFVRVDDPKHSLRKLALDQTASEVKFYPEWGRNRMRGMLESRPDWCISRQRAWGLPIPAFLGPEKGQVLLTPASVRAVAARFRSQGSDCWFKEEPAQILEQYNSAADPQAPDWMKNPGAVASLAKGGDIFDVWFESGSSWNSVLRQRGLPYPADLYLEGSDQHRGWFQLSLLPSIGVTGQAPFKAVLTHGFMVDKDGRKMSKSLGNALEVETLLKEYGADICRWWVASLNTDNDIKVDPEFFRLAGEEYRKIRNTIRFLLSNLSDFDPAKSRRELSAADAASLDAWVMGELAGLVGEVRTAYESYQFKKVHEAVFHFCNDTLSAVYLAATKDRLYCDRPDSARRRRTQTVMFDLADALIRLAAPILVHTADEAWLALRGENPDQPQDENCCVHQELLPAVQSPEAIADWSGIFDRRDQWMKALEKARSEEGIDNPLDCGLRVPAEEALRAFDAVDLADLCGVSRFERVAGLAGVEVLDLRQEPRCDRSWKRDGTVRQRSDGGLLTDRDAEAVGV